MVFGHFSKLLYKMMTDHNFEKYTHIGGDLMQRDYGNQLYGERRREFYCQNGKTLVNARTYNEAKKHINSCGSGSWPKDIITLYNAALSKHDKNCCDQHDACYQGYYLGTGRSRIQNNNRVSNKQCEEEFSWCMARYGSSQGKLFPKGTQMVSPNYYKSKRFICI
jgi:hypothetical protein